MSNSVKVERTGDVWTLSLARPEKRNALSGPMVDQLLELVHKAPREGAKVLVFRGEGKNFSAGFDFSEVEQQSEGDLVLRFVRVEMLLQAVASSPCFTVALAHGRIFGAGVDLIASCRKRIATADASFRMPGLKFGLVLGTRRFAGIVGREQAASVLEAAATFDAAEARRMGFVHEVAAAPEWAAIIESARATATVLPESSRNALYQVLSSGQADADLAWLVRSAAQPGLKNRIADYLRAS